MVSGQDIKIIDSGQRTTLTEIEPKRKITDAYWKDEYSDKKHRIEYPDYPITLYLKTSGYAEGDTATIKLRSKEGLLFEGGQKELTVSGTVNEDRSVIIEDFKVTYEKEN